MGSLLPGWDKSYSPAKGLKEFDDALKPDEPESAGSNYQRRIMKKYLSRGTSLLGDTSHSPPDESLITRLPSLKRESYPGPSSPLKRDSFGPSSPLKRDSVGASLKRDSVTSGGDPASPRLTRAGSLRMPARALSCPAGNSPTARAAREALEEGPDLEGDKATSHGWWGRMDSAAMNRQVEEGDEDYRTGSYKPQLSSTMHYAMPAKGVTKKPLHAQKLCMKQFKALIKHQGHSNDTSNAGAAQLSSSLPTRADSPISSPTHNTPAATAQAMPQHTPPVQTDASTPQQPGAAAPIVPRASDGKSGVIPPPSYCCPISMELMEDPVIVATGHTYDRVCIERWLQSGNKTCPVTGTKLRHNELTPNFALRTAIQEWAAEYGIKFQAQPTSQPVTAGTPVVSEEATRDNVLQGHDEIVWAVEVSGHRLYSASADKTVRVWDIPSRRCIQVLEDHTRPVLSLAICGNKLFSGSYDFTIRVWDLTTLTRIATLQGHTDAVRSLAVANGKLFSGSYDGSVRVWNTETLEPLKTLQGHTGPVRTLVSSGNYIFSGSYDKTVRVWNIQTLECVSTLHGHTAAVRALVATPRRVYSGSDDTTIKVWDSQSLKCLQTLEGHEDNCRVLAINDRYLFSGSWDKTIRVWDLQSLACVKVLEGHLEAVLALAVGSRHLVSGSYDTTVRFWDLQTMRCARKCEGHRDAIRVLAAHGDQVFSGSYDGTIGVWMERPDA